MTYKFITGQRVYVYRLKLNIKNLKKDMYGIVEHAEDISKEDWMGGPDFTHQILYILLDGGKRIKIDGGMPFAYYNAIPTSELHKL